MYVRLLHVRLEHSTLNNYLMWRLAHNYLPYLSREFWEVLDIHKRDTLGKLLLQAARDYVVYYHYHYLMRNVKVPRNLSTDGRCAS